MKENTIANLFSQISNTIEEYDKISLKSGEKFNVFNILRLSTKEVRLHSAFIAELLNPKGSHGQGDAFLKLFTEQIEVPYFICKNAIVKVEMPIGNISLDKTEGGNIDIFAIDKNSNAIIIENKIHARDQKNQLLRYYNYGKNTVKGDFKLFYLTLDGKDAIDYTKCGLTDKQFTRISYSLDILKWLEECLTVASDHKILKETLNQYIFLIKQLTYQTTNHEMKDKIVNKICENSSYIKALFEIQKEDIVKNVKRKLVFELKKQMVELVDIIKKNSGVELELVFDETNLGSTEGPSYIKFNLKNSKKGFYISFGFCTFFQNMFYVVNCNEAFKNECRDEVCNLIGNRDKEFFEIWVKWFDTEYKNWDISPDPWLAIISGELKENMKGKIEDILSSLKGYQL